MRIKLTALLLLAMLLLAGCASHDAVQTEPVSEEKAETMTTVHFPGFELDVPAGWTVRGNLGKVYEGDGLFLLVGPATSGDYESAIAENLELLFNTEYYRSQVQFSYDRYESGSGRPAVVEGILTNGRSGTELRFAGAYNEQPGAYFLYFWKAEANRNTGRALMEATYESFRVL